MSKDLGLISEMRFELAATLKGFTVSKPQGDNSPYDFIVDTGTRLLRVQVKGTKVATKYGYYKFPLHTGYSKAAYTASQVHFFVFYVQPIDSFFLIPQALLRGRKYITLSANGKFKAFKENWDFSPGKVRYERDEEPLRLPIEA